MLNPVWQSAKKTVEDLSTKFSALVGQKLAVRLCRLVWAKQSIPSVTKYWPGAAGPWIGDASRRRRRLSMASREGAGALA